MRIYIKFSCISIKICSKKLHNQWYITATYNVIYLCAVTVGLAETIEIVQTELVPEKASFRRKEYDSV